MLIAIQQLPITSLMLAVAVGLLSVRLAAPFTAPDADPLHYFPGAIHVKLFVEHPEIHGPFDLWNGEWWRLLGSAFHHINVVHLLLNSMGIWSCARIVERAMGWWRYLIFFLTAAVVSMLPEVFLGVVPVGLSGVFYAMFGVLLVLRTCNEGIRQAVPLQFIYVGFGWLFVCVFLTITDIMPIANGAHAVGLLYGALVGWVMFRFRQRWPALSVMASQLIHLTVFVAAVLAINPLWNGSYHAWLASKAEEAQQDTFRCLRHWQTATAQDPRLIYAWLRQAQLEDRLNRPKDAWKTVLKGAKSNRTDEKLIEAVRRRWKKLRGADAKQEALEELRRVFGSEADAWIARLRLTDHNLIIGNIETLQLDEPASEPTLDVDVDLQSDVLGITKPHPPEVRPNQVDPQQPNSARLGESL